MYACNFIIPVVEQSHLLNLKGQGLDIRMGYKWYGWSDLG
jgi:hypothetical protein